MLIMFWERHKAYWLELLRRQGDSVSGDLDLESISMQLCSKKEVQSRTDILLHDRNWSKKPQRATEQFQLQN